MSVSKYSTVLLVVAGLAVFGAACGKKITEKTIENTIERSTNGQADVDIDNNQVQINTNGSSFTAGGDIKLPDNFPSDVYVIDGTLISAITTAEDNGFSISLNTTTSATDAKTKYESELSGDGWTIVSTVTLQQGSMLTAEKGQRTVSVTISESEGKTMVSVATRTKTS